VDCHNPHAVAGNLVSRSVTLGVPGTQLVPPQLVFSKGLTRNGVLVDHARYEYEVCLKCHADNPASRRETVDRHVSTLNARRDFAIRNQSYHPVFGPGRNKDVPSLQSPLTTSSVITCTDCHESDNARNRGGSGPNGPHGSIYEPLLANNYSTRDPTTESPQAYALCYDCHSRSSILGNDSFPLHNLHVVREQASCSACHDAHGVPASGRGGDHTHLINFDRSVVRVSGFSRRINYTDGGRFAGSCTLTCHDVSHEGWAYQR